MAGLEEPLLLRRAGKKSKRRSLKDRLLLAPTGWAAITLIVAVITHRVMRPTPCSEVEQCVLIDHETVRWNHAFAATGLGTVFLHESASLFLTYKSLKQAKGMLGELNKVLLPSLLLCCSFVVLFGENLALFTSERPWYAHSTHVLGDSQGDAPVYTIFYVEWLINVPILLVLAGKCALDMELRDIARPIVVTNLYIIAAWACYFIENPTMRGCVVTLSFAMYAWASYDMVQWVRNYLKEKPDSSTGLYLRPSLTVSLIVIFGIYGIVFLGRFHGSVTARGERLFYTFMDIGSKLLVSMVFTGVRSSHYHSILIDMLANTNTVFQRGFNNITTFDTPQRRQSSGGSD